jgi:hypothetical protein
MNDSKLKLLVTEAVELDRAIAADLEILKELKSQLSAEAKARKSEATKTDGGGTSISFEGLDGCVCRVTKAAPGLKSSINSEQENFDEICALANGNHFAVLFVREISWALRSEFREKSKELLPDDVAKKLIKLCENPGKMSVSFETKKAEAFAK